MAVRVAPSSEGPLIHVHTRRPARRRLSWRLVAGAVVLAANVAALFGCLGWVLYQEREPMSSPAGAPAPASLSQVARGALTAGGTVRSGLSPRPPREQPDSGATSGWDEGGDEDNVGSSTPWADRLSGPEHPFVSNEPVKAQNSIDERVFAQLRELDLPPARLCSDAVFLRRVYLDTLGTLPTVEEAREFLDDRDPQKRAALVEHVLERPEFADYWAMKWCDLLRVKAEFPIKLWPNAAQAYHRWVRTSLRDNLPYDEFARELLTASGSNFRTPQVNFYRAVQSKEPQALAEAVALTFLCERTSNWPAEKLDGMSAFFSQVGYKPTGEWKEEIVYHDRRKARAASEGDESPAAVFPDGTPAQMAAGVDPRQVFADWLVGGDNTGFAQAIANRVWYWLLGRGIVDPPDDVRPDNPASNPALLNELAAELVAADYDLRHLYRLILNSHTYQLSCVPASPDPQAAVHFAHYAPRRLDAEVLIDAICQVTGTSEDYSSIIPEPYTFLPEHQRAIALPDGSITSSFLEMFGRPPRDTGLMSERNNRFTAAQALHLLNSNHLRNKLRQGAGLRDLVSPGAGPRETAELLYLAILSRRPTDSELLGVEERCRSAAAAQEVAWALINSDEFLFRH